MAHGSGLLLPMLAPRLKVMSLVDARLGSTSFDRNGRHSVAPRLITFLGKRKDLDEVKVLLDSGASFSAIADEHFSAFIRYEKGFRSYKLLKSLRRDWPMDLIIIVGPSGTGKSRYARTTYPLAFWKAKGPWWDGYDGEETVVIDEMYGHCFPFSELLQLLDRYPYKVPVKGGTMEFVSKRIVMTSNQHPRDWYSSEKTHQGSWEESPLFRRIREYGTLILTGEVHRAIPTVVVPVAARGDLDHHFGVSLSEFFNEV